MDCRDMKKYLSIFIAALLAFAAVSCEKKAEFERPLGLMSRLTRLSASAGDTPVIVYSNTDWNASLTSKVTWAGLDRLSGSGCSQVRFRYSENYGRARKVGIAFEAGGVRDTLYMIQASGLDNPLLEFASSSAVVPVQGGVQEYVLNSNLVYDIKDVKAEIRYGEDSPENWLEVVSVELDKMSVNISPNGSGIERTADIVLLHTDGADDVISTWISIKQFAL